MGDSSVIASQKTMRLLEDVVEMALTLARLRLALWRCRRKWDKHRWRSTWRPAELWLCTVRRNKKGIFQLLWFYKFLFGCGFLFTVKHKVFAIQWHLKVKCTSFSSVLLWKNRDILWMSSDFSHCLVERKHKLNNLLQWNSHCHDESLL